MSASALRHIFASSSGFMSACPSMHFLWHVPTSLLKRHSSLPASSQCFSAHSVEQDLEKNGERVSYLLSTLQCNFKTFRHYVQSECTG